jgi:HD-like signal output (HDOD) protein
VIFDIVDIGDIGSLVLGLCWSVAMNIDQIATRIRGARELPGLSATGHKLMKMIGDPEVTMQRIAAVVALDPPLAGGVMRIANSSAYGFSEPTKDLGTALTRIGLRMLKTLTVATSVLRSVETVGRIPELDRRSHWRFCLAAAIAARLVSDHHRPMLDEDAFLAGLLQGVGLTVLDVFFPDKLREAMRVAKADKVSLAEGIRGTLGIPLTEISALMITEWEIDTGVGAVVHAFENEGAESNLNQDQTDTLRYLRIGIALAQTAGIGLPLSGLQDNLDELRAQIDLTDEQWVQMITRLERDFRVFEGLAANKAA